MQIKCVWYSYKAFPTVLTENKPMCGIEICVVAYSGELQCESRGKALRRFRMDQGCQ